jgi:WD40 repeat protein
MRRRIGLLVAAFLVALAPFSWGAPVPIRHRPAISAGNAAKIVKVAELPRDVWQIVWGPLSSQVSLLSWESSVEVLDARSFRPVRKFGAGRRLIHFAFSRDGQTVAWAENNSMVEIRKLGRKALVLETNNPQPRMAFSPDGRLLATGGYGTQAKLWDARSGRLVRVLDAPMAGGLTAVFSPDGKLLAIGNRNDVTRIYEVATGKLRHVLARRWSQELKFNPKGSILAVAYVDGSVGLWNVADGRLLRLRKTTAAEIYSLDWSRGGDVLATSGLKGKVVLWDVRDLSVLKELEAPEWVIRVRFSPDGSRLFWMGGSASAGLQPRKVSVWGLPAGVK